MKTRVIVYTGKGGVGKTSVAASTAVLCAERGYRTLVLSADIAHSLTDVFGRRIGPQPVRLAARLWAQETDSDQTLRSSWSAIQDYFASLFQWRGLDAVVADELAVVPGLDELANLLAIVEHFESGRYDVIIVDAAPTGQTMRLLSLPEAMRWWLDHVLPIQRRATQIAGPVLRRVTGIPVPDETVFRASEDLFRTFGRMQRVLSDPATTSVRIVLNLEKMVIAEAWRSFTYLHLFGYVTDLVVCNRVLPAASGDYFASWREVQQRYWSKVTESFAPVPVRQLPYFPYEVAGMNSVRELGVALFGDTDPRRFFFRGRPYRVERENGGFSLSLELPFVSEGEVELLREREELMVQVGSWRRNLILPRALAARPAGDVKLADGILRVHFGARRG